VQRATIHSAIFALAFLGILGLATYIRITSASNTIVNAPIRNDAADYVAYSYNWKNLNVYSRQVTWVPDHAPDSVVSDAVRPPGYPAFLLLFLSGKPDAAFVRAVMYAQASIGIAIVVLAFLLARLLLGSIAALFVMLLTAISPHLVVMENYLLTETLYTAFVVLMVGVGALALRRPCSTQGIILAVTTGATIAICGLIRPTLEHLALVVLVATCVLPGLREYRKSALCGLGAFVVMMAPWWTRNIEAIGHVSDGSLMVRTVHHGSYPDFMYKNDPASLGYPYNFDPHSAEAEANLGAALSDIVHKFATEPARYLKWYLFGKVRFFFNWKIVDGFGEFYTYPELETPYYGNALFVLTASLMFGLHWPLVIAALLGSMLSWTRFAALAVADWRLRAMRWLSLVLLYAIAVHMIGAPFPRYSIPFRPLEYILAVFAVMVFVGWVKEHRRTAGRQIG